MARAVAPATGATPAQLPAGAHHVGVGPKLTELLDRWAAEKKPGADTMADWSLAVSRLMDAVVSRIGRAFANTSAPAVVEVNLRIRVEPTPRDAVIAAYEKDVDRTLIRENLRLSLEQRLTKLRHWQESMGAIRGTAQRRKRRRKS